MNKQTRAASITGRDGYINSKAILYAIAHIQSLPEWRREWSDMHDMTALIRHDIPNRRELAILAAGVERHTGSEIDLFPHLKPGDVDQDRMLYEYLIAGERAAAREIDRQGWSLRADERKAALLAIGVDAADLTPVRPVVAPAKAA